MTPARPVAAVLALVAGHVAAFVKPKVFPSPPAAASFTGRSAARAVSHAAGAGATAITTTSDRNSNTVSMILLGPGQCRNSGFVPRKALMLQHRRPAAGAAVSCRGRGKGMDPINAVQSISVRQLSSPPSRTTTTTTAVAATTAAGQQQQQVQQGGGPPAGGYPPPEHLHGVLAVYKPKGFSSNDVVQKIKVRQRSTQRNREASERPAVHAILVWLVRRFTSHPLAPRPFFRA